MSTEQKKLTAANVLIGKSLQQDVFSRNGFLLLGKGHYVLTPEQKGKLLSLGYMDAADAAVAAEEQRRQSEGAARQAEQQAVRATPFEDMTHLYRRCRSLLGHALSDRQFVARVGALADTIRTQMATRPDGMLASILLVPFQNYSSAHAVHTTCLLALLAERLQIEAAQRHSLLCAGLTMNIALSSLQDALHAQRDTLSADQQQQVQSHPLLGSAILREAGVTDELWHQLVQSHHESWSGKGYPYALTRVDIHPLAHLLHMADITCAKLTPRSYRHGLLPASALGQVFQHKDAEYDSHFITLLIKEMGIYPPGSFVTLASDEIAVVVERREKPGEPRVAALRKTGGAPYGEPLMRDTRLSQWKIVAPAPAASAGVRPGFLARLWQD